MTRSALAMQRSIGAAVERLAVDLYASRWDGTPRRLCPLCPLTFKENTGIHWSLPAFGRGHFLLELIQNLGKNSTDVWWLCYVVQIPSFSSPKLVDLGFISLSINLYGRAQECWWQLLHTWRWPPVLQPKTFIRVLKLMACDRTSAWSTVFAVLLWQLFVPHLPGEGC